MITAYHSTVLDHPVDRVWFEEFDSAPFDQQIKRDAASGKLDRLAEQALDDLREGRAREL